jgi:hypothetical protein
VGTTNPADLVTLSGSGSQPAIRLITDAGTYNGVYHRIFPAGDGTALAISADKGNSGAGSYIRFDVDDTERMRILSGGGITFNGDTATANALDDYEEGSWTPTTVQGASVNNIDAGNCRYTKIGNTVHIRGEFWNLSSTTSSALIMGGLPYTVANGVESAFPVMYHQVNLDSGYTQLTGYAQSNSNNFRFYESGDAVNWSALRGDQCGSSTDFIFAITYEAA